MTTTPLTNYPLGFMGGVTIRNIPILNTYSGKVFWVDSVNGNDNNNGVYNHPFASLAKAITKTLANRGDIIILKPGHAETLTTAGAVTLSTAGVEVIGLGVGSERAAFTLQGITTASILVSAAGVTIRNIIVIGNLASLVNPINVTASDCTLDIEYRDTSSALTAVSAIVATTVSRLWINLVYKGVIGNTVSVNPINLVAVSGARINIDFYGTTTAGGAVVQMVTTLSTDIAVTGRSYNSRSAYGSNVVVDSLGTSTWRAQVDDAYSGLWLDGGSSMGGMASPDTSNWRSLTVQTVANATWWTQTAHRVAAVTGVVEMFITPVTTVNLGSGGAATLALGDTTTAASLIAASTFSGFTTTLPIWSATVPVSAYAGANSPGAVHAIVSAPNNIGYTVAGAALNAGTLAFYINWRPLSIGATVTAGAGGAPI
jgi:hypothetical protein